MDSNKSLKQDYFIKILLLGDGSVGKSSLLRSYSEGEFPSNLTGTLSVDSKTKNIKHQGKLLKIQIWDTVGHEKFFFFFRQCYEGISCIFLFYDVTNQESFENISSKWLPKIIENSETNIELALVGNKTDLINERLVT